MGLKRKIELSDHSIEIELSNPDKDKRAWDTNLYRNGNVFVSGYANPIKPSVEHNPQLETKDTVTVEHGDVDGDETEDTDETKHISLISSSRYRDYMRQDLISQLLTPQEQWKLLAYGIIGVGILQFLTMIVIVYATGGF